MDTRSVDYIIVGQGLAGSCMALQMLKHGRSFVVFDDPQKNICSSVAAGLFNPITGQHFVKTWLADRLFPYLHRFYTEAEETTGAKFFFPMPMYRPFLSVEEQNDWMAKSAEPEYVDIVGRVYAGPAVPGIRDPFGGLVLRQSGYIDTLAFMAAVRERLIAMGSYRGEWFDPSSISFSDDQVHYNDVRASRIVFCEGIHVNDNPWFDRAPVRQMKGETIRIKSEFTRHVIVNRGVYMVPAKTSGEWKVGATYNPKDTSRMISPQAQAQLLEKLTLLADFEFSELQQEWGMRPVSPDRRPILGKHPGYSRMFIFNGLGTKGVSLAPYFSEVLFRGMEAGHGLDKEVDLSRF